MALKNTQILSFVEDFFSDIKMTLQPENLQFYEEQNGVISVESLLALKYFKKHNVDCSQLEAAIKKSSFFNYDQENHAFSRVAPYRKVDISDFSLLVSGIECSNFPTINRDIKWFIAKTLGVFPKFVQGVKSKVFGRVKCLLKVVCASEEDCQRIYEGFGSQPHWDESKIEKSGEFFESSTWKNVKEVDRENYVSRMLAHKDAISQFIICLRYTDLHKQCPRNLVVHTSIVGDAKDLCAWMYKICPFIFYEYENGDLRGLLRPLPEAKTILIAKHEWNERTVHFSTVDEATEWKMWEKCISIEKQKNRL